MVCVKRLFSHTLVLLVRKPHMPRLFDAIDVSKHMARVEGLDGLEIHAKVLDEMLNGTHHLSVCLEEVLAMVLVVGVCHEFFERLLQVEHAIDGAERIGVLNIGVLDGHNASDVLQLMLGPLHDAMTCRIIMMLLMGGRLSCACLLGHGSIYGIYNLGLTKQ